MTDIPRGASSIAIGPAGGKYSKYMKPGRYILSTDTWGLTRKETFGSAASFMQEAGGDFYDVVGYTSLKLVVHSDGSYNLWSRSGMTKIAQIRSAGGPESIMYVDPLEEAGFEVRAPTVATPSLPASLGFPTSPTPSLPASLGFPTSPTPSSVAEKIRESMPIADPAAQLAELERLAREGAVEPRELAEARQEIESQLISKAENATWVRVLPTPSVPGGQDVILPVHEVGQVPVPGGDLTPVPNPKEIVSGSVEEIKDILKPKIGTGW
jgi:hypothetical protein